MVYHRLANVVYAVGTVQDYPVYHSQCMNFSLLKGKLHGYRKYLE